MTKARRAAALRWPSARGCKRACRLSSADTLYLVMTDRFADGNPAKEKQGYDRAAAKGRHGEISQASNSIWII